MQAAQATSRLERTIKIIGVIAPVIFAFLGFAYAERDEVVIDLIRHRLDPSQDPRLIAKDIAAIRRVEAVLAARHPARAALEHLHFVAETPLASFDDYSPRELGATATSRCALFVLA